MIRVKLDVVRNGFGDVDNVTVDGSNNSSSRGDKS